MSTNFSETPKHLLAPVDDDAAAHLEGWVLYSYPMNGWPDVPLPDELLSGLSARA
ncbi:MAG TPA: hypothetical protein VE136_01695 [Anaerolineales bacterium]|jgi:hypothetical protein|nr:hypothetical protein [Anaerolineales bacterium]